MDVTSITGGITPQKPVERESARLRSVVDSVVKDNVRKSDSVSEQTTAARLQAREAGLRQAAGGLARVGTLAERAEEGVREIREEVRKLRGGDKADFRRVRDNVDRVVRDTTFEDSRLLDGTYERASIEEALSGKSENKDDVTLKLPDLSSRRLLGDSPEPRRLDEAERTLDGTLSEIQNFRVSVEVVAASIETVAANQQAARADLHENDLDRGIEREIRQNREAAVGAQARNLNPALMKLVN